MPYEIAPTTSFTDEEHAQELLNELLEDAYYGQYDSEEEFTENFVSECYGLPRDFPSWIKIDWKETWEDGLSWDYTFYDGYVFCNHW